jgi:hypothetical protein
MIAAKKFFDRWSRTIKVLEQRGLISPGKDRDSLTVLWHLKEKAK